MANGDPLLLGTNANNATNTTELDVDFGAPGLEVTNQAGHGVTGNTGGQDCAGVSGFSNAAQGGRGVYGRSDGPDGTGVDGLWSSTNEGVGVGVHGKCDGAGGAGVFGESTLSTGVRGQSQQSDAVQGTTSGFNKSGVVGENTGNTEVILHRLNEPGADIRVFGVTGRADSFGGVGVLGESARGTGVVGTGGTYGADLSGGKSPLRLQPSTTVGAPTGGSHARGELFVDSPPRLCHVRAVDFPRGPLQR